MLFVCHPKVCISMVFSFSWGRFNSQEKLKTMLMQNFGVTNKELYGMLWYFWSGWLDHFHGRLARASTPSPLACFPRVPRSFSAPISSKRLLRRLPSYIEMSLFSNWYHINLLYVSMRFCSITDILKKLRNKSNKIVVLQLQLSVTCTSLRRGFRMVFSAVFLTLRQRLTSE